MAALLSEQATRIQELTAANATLTAKLATLEHLQSRNSRNSSMPPSGDDAPGKTPPPVKPKRAGEGRKRGKQPGAPGSHLEFRGKPDVYENRFPEGACGCGADLKTATDLGVVDSYQQTDIPEVTVTVTQHDMHKVACGCGRVHTATRPDGARQGRVGYGPNLQAFAVYLMVEPLAGRVLPALLTHPRVGRQRVMIHSHNARAAEGAANRPGRGTCPSSFRGRGSSARATRRAGGAWQTHGA